MTQQVCTWAGVMFLAGTGTALSAWGLGKAPWLGRKYYEMWCERDRLRRELADLRAAKQDGGGK
jgi:hypothetical protein